MIDEPEITPDDTNPHRPAALEALLSAEEPPIRADDTNPSRTSRLDARLRAEEPPVTADDTSPSRAVPHFLRDEWPPRTPPRSRSRLQSAVAALLLSGALALAALAGYLWTHNDDDQPPVGGDAVPVAQNQPTVAPGDTPPAASATVAPTNAPANAPVQLPAATFVAQLFPTAAADEIAAALLTPAPDQPPQDVIQRGSAPFTTRRGSGRTQVVQYTVQDGDTLQSIAAQFNLDDYFTLIWSNKSSKYNPLRPGAQLNILPVDGIYYEVTEPITIAALAEKYKVDPYAIIDSEYNDLFGSIPDTLLPQGMWVVVPGGQSERELFLSAPSAGTGSTGTSDTVSGTYILWGCTANVGGGSPPYSRPLANYTFMRGMVPGGHTGVDLAADTGTQVFAAGAGTVVYSGWNDTGYGNVVVIAHGSTFTLYGHLSRRAVSCNQQVSAGQVIGYVGSTGNSSGPHLHFEVRDANWNILNPQNWIGF